MLKHPNGKILSLNSKYVIFISNLMQKYIFLEIKAIIFKKISAVSGLFLIKFKIISLDKRKKVFYFCTINFSQVNNY